MSTVAAISTPSGSGGIGVIRISGEDAIQIADKVFFSVNGKKLCDIPGYSALYGNIKDEQLNTVDEAVALVFRAPKSYTGENVVELSCHGGSYVVSKVLRLVFANGAQAAGPGEFTKRAFLNGKMDLTKAEAVINIISARGNDALNAAVNTLEGFLSKRAAEIKSMLVSVSAALSVWADYPDDDIPAVSEETLSNELKTALNNINSLIKSFDYGQAVTQGVDTVICGKPNVGKSALMNLLTGKERSIVTSVAGTTRDIIEENVMLGNVLLRLSDTAGIHGTGDEVESIGVNKAVEKISRANFVLAVFDGSRKLDEEDFELIELCRNKRSIALINKTDLEIKTDKAELEKYFDTVIMISAKNGSGYEELKTKTEVILGTADIDTSEPMLMNERQYKCCFDAEMYIKEASDALNCGMTFDAVNISIDSAIERLSELTGEKVSDTVVNEIFSKFCVGK